MQARDIMQTEVIAVWPDTAIRDIAERMLTNRISAVPVIDDGGRLMGIVSEVDLMRRPESGTERHRSWWLSLLASAEENAQAYVKTHSRLAKDVMTRNPITVNEDTPLDSIADTLEKHRIKRVPVLRDDKLVGIVSRADLLRGLVARKTAGPAVAEDRSLRDAVNSALSQAGVRPALLNVMVSGGIVHMWGAVESKAEKRAARIAAESVPGVKGVREETAVLPLIVRSFIGGV